MIKPPMSRHETNKITACVLYALTGRPRQSRNILLQARQPAPANLRLRWWLHPLADPSHDSRRGFFGQGKDGDSRQDAGTPIRDMSCLTYIYTRQCTLHRSVVLAFLFSLFLSFFGDEIPTWSHQTPTTLFADCALPTAEMTLWELAHTERGRHQKELTFYFGCRWRIQWSSLECKSCQCWWLTWCRTRQLCARWISMPEYLYDLSHCQRSLHDSVLVFNITTPHPLTPLALPGHHRCKV